MFWKFVISYGRYRVTPTYTFGGGLLRHCTHGALNNYETMEVSMEHALKTRLIQGQESQYYGGKCECGKTWYLPSVEAIKFQHGHHAGVWDEEVMLLWG